MPYINIYIHTQTHIHREIPIGKRRKMMIGAQLSGVRTIAAGGAVADRTNPSRSISSSRSYSSIHFSFKLGLHTRKNLCKLNSVMIIGISCKSSRGSFSHKSNNSEARDDGDRDDYVEAVVLLSETTKHYHMLTHGFQERPNWQSSAELGPFSVQVKDPRANVNSIGTGFFRRFQHPTIFLKVSCDGDFVLPIIVGEYAVENLIDSVHEDETGDCQNHFQLLRNLLERLGYEVKMVMITERVVNTYFARIFFHKAGEKDILSVDLRPSDAINIARRWKAPIFVNKHIILTDAIRIVYGMSRTGRVKCTYDVLLDSAMEGPDLLSQELNLLRNMNLAAKEERYGDAAMWRDKLMEFLRLNT